MKLLSIAIPCYNSEKYMRKCIDSLLIGGEDVEILIIDDGSTKDRTAEIADEYEAQFPTIVRAIHKENGGHGSAVNTGIANATGLYFKVVDSDDWVKQDAEVELAQIAYGEDAGEGVSAGEVAVGAATLEGTAAESVEGVGVGQEAAEAKLSEDGVEAVNQDMEATVEELIRQKD